MMKKRKNNQLPYLTEEMILAQAQRDLLTYQQTKRIQIKAPIFPEEIAEALWGISIEPVEHILDDSEKEVLAQFIPEANKILINTSTAGTEGRRSFSIAHEVGHASLHAYLSKVSDARNWCTSTGESSDDNIEKQADKYASVILMPDYLVNEIIAELGIVGTIDLKKYGPVLCKYFNVSRYALEIRLAKLNYETVGNLYKIFAKRIPEEFFENQERARASWSI